MKLIKQIDEKDCGAACLAMILQHHGSDVSVSKMKEAVMVDKYGANISGIQNGAEKYGLDSKAFKGSANDVWEAIRDKEIPLPAILRIINEKNYEHFIVVSGIKNNELMIYDPDKGKYSLSPEIFRAVFLNNIIVFEKKSGFKRVDQKSNMLRSFFSMITHQKALIVLISLLSFIVTGIGLSGTFLFQFIIDKVISVENDQGTLLFVVVAALGSMYFVRFAVELVRGKLLTKMSMRMNIPLVCGFFNHVTNLPANFFENHTAGAILSRMGDASKISEAISGTTLTLFIDVLLVCVSAFILYMESPTLFIIALIVFAAYFVVSLLYINPLEKVNRTLMESDSDFTSYAKETIDGNMTVKISQAEKTVSEHIAALFSKCIKMNSKNAMLQISKESLIQIINNLGTLVILWVGTQQIMAGNLSVGALVTFTTMMGYFLSPVESIVDLQTSIQSAVVAAERLNDVMNSSIEKSGTEDLTTVEKIEFDSVDFRYGNREPVLSGVSFSAEKGQKIAFVGESGSGKSTITKLLLKFYNANNGHVKINGKDIGTYSLKSIRNRVSTVNQHTFLFSDTVRNNLTFGLDVMPDDDEIEKILNICKCDFVYDLALGLDSPLDENGMSLSGGQRQRLAIARALLRDPDVLILDEATSALDSETEREIINALNERYSHLIIVSVAHRLSTVMHADKIVVMDHGKIVESGKHTELLGVNESRYAKLWHAQNSGQAA